MLDHDHSSHSMKLPLEACDTEEVAGIGVWVLLELTRAASARLSMSGRALRDNVRNTELSE